MEILVNGETHEVSEGISIAQLLREFDMDPEESGIAVALDQQVILREQWKDTELDEGSEIEIIHAVQGGYK